MKINVYFSERCKPFLAQDETQVKNTINRKIQLLLQEKTLKTENLFLVSELSSFTDDNCLDPIHSYK